eukprot:1161833-Pelagomonas_calceolata.AAC.15
MDATRFDVFICCAVQVLISNNNFWTAEEYRKMRCECLQQRLVDGKGVNVFNSDLWTAGEYVYNHFVEGIDKDCFLAPDRINAAQGAQKAGLGCCAVMHNKYIPRSCNVCKKCGICGGCMGLCGCLVIVKTSRCCSGKVKPSDEPKKNQGFGLRLRQSGRLQSATAMTKQKQRGKGGVVPTFTGLCWLLLARKWELGSKHLKEDGENFS